MSTRRARSLPPRRRSLPPIGRSPQHALSAPRSEVLDLAELRARAGHDEALVCELLEDFVGRAAGISELRGAAESHAFDEMGKMAHRLRGALLALGARSAGAVAEEVELQASALAIGTGAPDSLSLWVLSLALAELSKRVEEARDAMRAVLASAIAMTLSASA